jgi:hypothetical protein
MSTKEAITQPLMVNENRPAISENSSLLGEGAKDSALDIGPEGGSSGCFNVVNRAQLSSRELYWNFIVMCAGFSVNHGCVVSCLAYSTAELGTHMGGYGSGTLYVCYALTALFFSKPIVASLGPKNGLLIGTGGYCVYVGAFLAAILLKDGTWGWIFFLLACAIGGCSGGVLWTAQGRYFTRNAQLYGEALVRERATAAAADRDEKTIGGAAADLSTNPLQISNTEAGTGVSAAAAAGGGRASGSAHEDAIKEAVKTANADFAGFFAMTYLGCETACKVTATAIFLILSNKSRATNAVFASYTIAAVLAVVAVTRLSPLRDLGSGELSWAAISAGAWDAASLCRDDMRLLLLLPYQVNFGCVSTFVPYYIFGVIVSKSDSLGGPWIGCLSAVITLTGSLMGLPAAWISNRYGKPVLMVTGGICTAMAGISLFAFSDATIGTWGVIVPLLIIYGIGRGTWENVNKAVVADLYTDRPQFVASAFAAVSFSNGFSGSIAYFVFPSTSRTALGVTVVSVAVFGILSYLAQVKLVAVSVGRRPALNIE